MPSSPPATVGSKRWNQSTSDFECAVVPEGYGIEFRKAGKEGATVRLTIGDREASEELEAADYIYLTEDLSDYLGRGRELKWTPIP